MKSTLAVLIAGLIFLATPMLAAAHGSDRSDKRPQQYQSWSKDRSHADHYRGYDSRWDRKEMRHFKKQIRTHRQELRHFNKQVRKHQQARRHFARQHRPQYVRPVVHRNPAVVLGIPRVVFHIDW